jgi:hypothetical protein
MGIRGQSGNIAVLLLLGLFLLGLAGGGLYLLRPSQADDSDRAAKNARLVYDEAVDSLTKALADSRSLEVSLDRNVDFQCLYSNDGSCQGKGGPFLLYDASQASHPLSHLARDAGLDPFGVVCKGYPSKECPLRVETLWEPVCGGPRCEGTKSLRVKAKVVLTPMVENGTPMIWSKDGQFTPQIQLSQAAVCARGGGQWASTECLTPSQAAERRIASPPREPASPTPPPMPENPNLRAQQEMPVPQQPVIYECPNQIVVQGQYYPVQFLSADRGQVSVPAMSCPGAGYLDVFVFQCAAKNPASFPNEGQWIQVEAVMAPPCGAQGGGQQNIPIRY